MGRAPAVSALKRKRPDSKSPVLSAQERPIYDLIHSKQDMGISERDIKREIKGIPENNVKKSLKSLVANNLVKEVKNIQNKGRNHFMAVEFEPSKELTGGEWYAEGKLDEELIGFMKKLCVNHIKKAKVATVEGIADAIKKSGVFNFECSTEQIMQIVKYLVLDNEIIEMRSSGTGDFSSIPTGAVCYMCRSSGGLGGESMRGSMASVPCGVCKVMSLCTPDGLVSPKTCPYYTDWLKEF